MNKNYKMLNYLNELLELDPKGVNKLFKKSVKVNNSIANHKHAITNMDYEMGPLGVINGYLSSNEEQLIMAVFEEGKIIKFEIYG